ncbi:MAG: hypothetical protein ACREP8_16565, partial [Candidatus Binatia bacterium]
MMIFAIKVFLAAIVAYLVARVSRHLDRKQNQQGKKKQQNWQGKQKQQNLFVPVVCAVAAILLSEVTDKVETWLNDPRPRVSAELKTTEILLKLKAHNPISTIAIDFPVHGRIMNVHDHHSPTDAVTVSKAVRGANIEGSLNNVEIFLTDIKPDKL